MSSQAELDAILSLKEKNEVEHETFNSQCMFTMCRTGDIRFVNEALWRRIKIFPFPKPPTAKALRQRRARYRQTHHKRMAIVHLELQQSIQRKHFMMHIKPELELMPAIGIKFQKAQARWPDHILCQKCVEHTI